MTTIYRCYDGDSAAIEEFDTLDAAREFMRRRGLRYFDWAWCKDDQVREYYIPDDEDEEDYEDDDGAYLPSITPVLVEGEEEEEDEEMALEESIYVDAKDGGRIKLNFVRESVDDDGDSTGEGVYVYINNDGDREYYHVIDNKSYYYVGDADPDIERVVDGIIDNIWIHHYRQDVLDECANDGDYDAVVKGYALSQKIEGGIDDEFIEAVRTGVEEWLIYRDDCFVKDGGRWLWRDDEGEEK